MCVHCACLANVSKTKLLTRRSCNSFSRCCCSSNSCASMPVSAIRLSASMFCNMAKHTKSYTKYTNTECFQHLTPVCYHALQHDKLHWYSAFQCKRLKYAPSPLDWVHAIWFGQTQRHTHTYMLMLSPPPPPPPLSLSLLHTHTRTYMHMCTHTHRHTHTHTHACTHTHTHTH